VKPDNPASVSTGIVPIFQILRILSRNHPENMSVHNKRSYIVCTKHIPKKIVYRLTMSEMGRAPEPKGRGSLKPEHKIIQNRNRRFVPASQFFIAVLSVLHVPCPQHCTLLITAVQATYNMYYVIILDTSLNVMLTSPLQSLNSLKQYSLIIMKSRK
jgi:hypothetical protein